jgi:hypothetical protein
MTDPVDAPLDISPWGFLEYMILVFLMATIFFVGRSSYQLYLSKTYASDRKTLLQMQSLSVDGASENLDYKVQDTSNFFGASWSQNDQLLVMAHHEHDFIRFKAPINSGKQYQLVLYLTKSYDFGIVQVFVNGAKLGTPIDLWSESVVPTGAIDIGSFTGSSDRFLLEFRVVGKNKESKDPFYQFGLDALELKEVGR